MMESLMNKKMGQTIETHLTISLLNKDEPGSK